MAPPPTRWAVLLTLLLPWAQLSHGLAISYCSPDLTAGDYTPMYAEFQSNGLCHDHCIGSYAFAVLQGYYCWCSNYAPADQVDTLSCNQDCPGTALEWCGSTAAGLYGYYNLGGQALGTTGGSSAVSTTPSTAGFPSTSPVPTSSSTLVTVAPAQSSVSYSSTLSTRVSSASPSTTTSPSPTTVASSTTAPAPVTPSPSSSSTTPATTAQPTVQILTQVTTVTGRATTILITPTASPADPTLGQSATRTGGVSTGKVVGIVLGVALGLGLMIGLAVFLWLRKKHAKKDHGMSPEVAYNQQSARSNNVPSRQLSQLSSSTLLGRGALGNKSLGTSNTTQSAETASSGFDRRSLGTDQRLNPIALYSHDEGRYSNLSLQDNQDYSRQLRVANPDP